MTDSANFSSQACIYPHYVSNGCADWVWFPVGLPTGLFKSLTSCPQWELLKSHPVDWISEESINHAGCFYSFMIPFNFLTAGPQNVISYDPPVHCSLVSLLWHLILPFVTSQYLTFCSYSVLVTMTHHLTDLDTCRPNRYHFCSFKLKVVLFIIFVCFFFNLPFTPSVARDHLFLFPLLFSIMIIHIRCASATYEKYTIITVIQFIL